MVGMMEAIPNHPETRMDGRFCADTLEFELNRSATVLRGTSQNHQPSLEAIEF